MRHACPAVPQIPARRQRSPMLSMSISPGAYPLPVPWVARPQPQGRGRAFYESMEGPSVRPRSELAAQRGRGVGLLTRSLSHLPHPARPAPGLQLKLEGVIVGSAGRLTSFRASGFGVGPSNATFAHQRGAVLLGTGCLWATCRAAASALTTISISLEACVASVHTHRRCSARAWITSTYVGGAARCYHTPVFS